nr:glycosyltransferase family 2 protein [Anaerolineae bacterium]
MGFEGPLVSIVIPNWNGVEFLPTCLDSLRQQSYDRVEIVVVDNASTDGSPELIRSQYREVNLIALEINQGFTGACNAGIEGSSGEIVILLNNDTEADHRWVEVIVDAFSRHADAGSLASKMLLFDSRHILHTAGDFMRIDGRPGNR